MSSVSVNPANILTLDDGFKYFSSTTTQGVYTANHLRKIADLLDKLNLPWETEINKYFTEHPD